LGTVVICIDGGCTNNGTPSARAGLGVYFGPNSPLNLSERVEDGEQTSQRAVLRAAVRALQQVQIALRDDIKTRKIVLLSDSKYLVDGITIFIHAWKENGWKGADGKPVVNQKDFKELDELIPVLEEDGLNVEFWYASREYNQSADKLATEACAA
ncbi:ribonuclease H-like protein, partial [Athelia psychrophila]